MWDLIVSVPDNCLSFYLVCATPFTDFADLFKSLQVLLSWSETVYVVWI